MLRFIQRGGIRGKVIAFRLLNAYCPRRE